MIVVKTRSDFERNSYFIFFSHYTTTESKPRYLDGCCPARCISRELLAEIHAKGCVCAFALLRAPKIDPSSACGASFRCIMRAAMRLAGASTLSRMGHNNPLKIMKSVIKNYPKN